ncbi:MAG: hypothetical protein M3Q69_11875 [Acidobacteriota bacterium]|nr:hypothetical protein [Acidobacteriota bacterium]
MRRLSLILFVLLVAASAFARDSEANGHWSGTLQVESGPLTVNVRLLLTPRGWRGRISFPSQEINDLPLERVDVADGAVHFQVAGLPEKTTFEGKLTGETIDGTYTQGAQSFALKLSRAPEPAAVK